MPEPQSEPLGQIHSVRRSVTFPTKLIPQSTRGSGAPNPNVAENVIFYHPSAKIVHFAPRALAPIPSSSAPTDFDYPVDTIETLPWRSATERTVATAPLRLEKVHGLTVFLKCGNVVHAILKNSQCWCVDGVSKFVLRIRPLTYYRIEIPHETQEEKGLVDDLKIALPTVLRYEVTPCPFKREFTVELPEEATAPRRKKAWRPKGRKEGVAVSSGSDKGSPGEVKPEWLDSISTGDDTDGAATDDSAVTPEGSDRTTLTVLQARDTSPSLSISDLTAQPRLMRRSVTETPQTFSSIRAKFDVPSVPEEQRNIEPAAESESTVESTAVPKSVLVDESKPVAESDHVSQSEPGSVDVPETAPPLTQSILAQPQFTAHPEVLQVQSDPTVSIQVNDGPAEVMFNPDEPVDDEKDEVESSLACADYDCTKAERHLESEAVVPTEPSIEDIDTRSHETQLEVTTDVPIDQHEAGLVKQFSEADALESKATEERSPDLSQEHAPFESDSKSEDELTGPIQTEAGPTESHVFEREVTQLGQGQAQTEPQFSKDEPVEEIFAAESGIHPHHSFSSTPESFHSAEPHSPSDSISTHATSLGSPSRVQKYKIAHDQDSSPVYPPTYSMPSDMINGAVSNAGTFSKDKPSNIDRYQMAREDPIRPSLSIPSTSKQTTTRSTSPSDLTHMSAEFRRRAQATRQRDVSPMPAPSTIYRPSPGEEAASLISKALTLVLVPPISLFIVLLHIAARIVINPSVNSTKAISQSGSQSSSKTKVPEDDFSFPLEREPSSETLSEYEDAQMTRKLDPWDLD
ncbi:uncharacterized protein N7503_009878 [Penicillium pulvis]|uniref:uncharacterized protein n=1 Tax=Penicillium pulvis TaxID=1562058 RepID=UPI0025496F6F|nr:uncharacterized protein N7503_009878 [Penicillium pulvis]KAJ5784666.1 hypothetical protein N7503_009878 [Penicillium pulvis]